MMQILILEDEIPAYKKMQTHLVDFFGTDLQLDHSRTVKEAIVYLKNTTAYDLILSDIRLLDGTAFEVFQQVKLTTPIIFCTAYDAHLLEAFQTNGIAYILKPYLKKDFETALEKFKILFKEINFEKSLFEELKQVISKQEKNYKKRFPIKRKDGIKLLEVNQISLVQANGDFCSVLDSQGYHHSISKSIGALMTELNPKLFFKINRSQLVHMEHIERIAPYAKNRLAVKLKGVKEHVITSSSSTKAFRIWLTQ